MKRKVSDLLSELGRRAPFDFAEDWDNVGLIVGDPDREVHGCIVAVNLGKEALDAAVNMKANVIVCHHPPIFKPTKKLTRTSMPYVYEALRRGISVIALHTNFDLASDQVSRQIAEKLGFRMTGYLANRGSDGVPPSLRQAKFITYVPGAQADRVRDAACRAGAGTIGKYGFCSFSWSGEGTFLGGEGTQPAIGEKGTLERVEERRLETIVPVKTLERVIGAARKAHPYEEMAYDVIELMQPLRNIGYGFISIAERAAKKSGSVDQSPSFAFHKIIDNVKELFHLKSVTVVGPGLENQRLRVKKLAFSPGSGSAFVSAAVEKRADVYVCGEVGYHQMLEAKQKGLTLIVLGHSYSERFFVEMVSEWCSKFKPVKRVFENVHQAF
ncbi:MAG: Nif3-like dinuclear metal center hexameric protein [Bdellovibrionota bacterium]